MKKEPSECQRHRFEGKKGSSGRQSAPTLGMRMGTQKAGVGEREEAEGGREHGCRGSFLGWGGSWLGGRF